MIIIYLCEPFMQNYELPVINKKISLIYIYDWCYYWLVQPTKFNRVPHNLLWINLNSSTVPTAGNFFNYFINFYHCFQIMKNSTNFSPRKIKMTNLHCLRIANEITRGRFIDQKNKTSNKYLQIKKRKRIILINSQSMKRVNRS